MSRSDDELDPLEAIAAEYLDRRRRGERFSMSELVARHPERASELRALLSVLDLVEEVKPSAEETTAEYGLPRKEGLQRERLGDYRIIREIGRGGMGVVYEAIQESLGRHVALKVISVEAGRGSLQVLRFLREARAAAGLHHTNIVPVFGVGACDGLHYYAMQYIRGLGLDQVLDEVRRLRGCKEAGTAAASEAETQRLGLGVPASEVARSLVGGRFEASVEVAAQPGPTRDSSDLERGIQSEFAAGSESGARYARSVARIGAQVAEALAYAHAHGVLHRDVKPSNILLDAQGTAWVTDFGLAKVTEEGDLTRTGDLVGTLRYMAPERFRGRGDGRSDVYALGLTLYELLALQPAFCASNREQLLHDLTQSRPAGLRTLSSGVPRDLETVIMKAIERDPGHRYGTAAAFAEDLHRFLDDRPVTARRVAASERVLRWARRNPLLAMLAGLVAALLLLIAAGSSALAWRLERERQLVVRAEAAARHRLWDSLLERARASRRGSELGRRSVGLGALAEAARLGVQDERGAELRDEAIACLAQTDLTVVNRRGVEPVPGYVGVGYDPHSGRIARGDSHGDIFIHEFDKNKAPVVLRGGGGGARAVLLRFSQDGRYLAVKYEAGWHPTLVVWDLGVGARVLEVADGVHAAALDFDPTGRMLAAGLRDGTLVFHELATGREFKRLNAGLVPQMIRFDPSGERLAIASPNSERVVQVRRVGDGGVAGYWTQPAGARTVEWDPTGHWLAASGGDGRIALLDTSGSDRAPRLLIGHDGDVVALAYHPDGSLLASGSWDGTLRLWDTRTGRTVVSGPVAESRPLRWSRDGKLLGPGDDGKSLWVWELSAGREYRMVSALEPASGAQSWLGGYVEGTDLLATAEESGLNLVDSRGRGERDFAALPGTAGLAVSPDGQSVFTGGRHGVFRWPVQLQAKGYLKVGPPVALHPAAVRPSGRVRLDARGRTMAVIVDTEYGQATVHDLAQPGPPVVLAEHPGLDRIAISPDGRRVATGTWRGQGVRIWDARTGARERELPVTGSSDVLFSPDGRVLVTGSGEEYVFWDTSTWEPRQRIARKDTGGLPGESAFHPEGRFLAIAQSRTLVQLIEPKTGSVLASLESPVRRHVRGLMFSPDGGRLAVTFDAGSVEVWDLYAIGESLQNLGLMWQPAIGGAEDLSSERRRVLVETAGWVEMLAEGEAHGRAGRWDEAARAMERAIECGVKSVEAWSRLALFQLRRGEISAYQSCCEHLLREFGGADADPATANNVAWICALSPGELRDYGPVIRLAERAVRGRAELYRLNTLGAVLYRAGQYEAAVQQIGRAIEAHGAGGTPYDALFLAMAHHRLGHEAEARAWLDRGGKPSPIRMNKPDLDGPSSWIPRIELEILQREAAGLILGE